MKSGKGKGATPSKVGGSGTPVAVAPNGVGHAGPHLAHPRRRISRCCIARATQDGE